MPTRIVMFDPEASIRCVVNLFLPDKGTNLLLGYSALLGSLWSLRSVQANNALTLFLTLI